MERISDKYRKTRWMSIFWSLWWLVIFYWESFHLREQFFTEVEVAGGKYPPLATDTVMNNCLSIYYNSEIIEHKIDNFYCCQRLQFLRANDRTAVTFSCRQTKLLKAFVYLLWGDFFKRGCELSFYLKPLCKKILNLVLNLFMNMSAK